jgi:hypothetical protein
MHHLLLLPRRQGPVLLQLSLPMQLLLNCSSSMCSSWACFRISADCNLTMTVAIMVAPACRWLDISRATSASFGKEALVGQQQRG